MKFKIYQPYFLDDQIANLDKEFEHIDHRDNPAPELREHPINLKCYDRAVKENLDVWGMFSWKWRTKLVGVSAQDIIDMVANNPGHDVYFFNPFSYQETFCYNVWEQGQWCHPHILTICEELFPALGIDTAYLYTPQSCTTMCWANYYMGNRQFWDGWLDIIDRYLKARPMLSEPVRTLHDGSADYGLDANLNHFAFIHERLFSTYIQMNQHRFSIAGYHHGYIPPHVQQLRDIKKQALEQRDLSQLRMWHYLRTPHMKPGDRDWAAEWILKLTT